MFYFEYTFWKISRVHPIFFPKQLIRTGCCTHNVTIGMMRQVFSLNLYHLKLSVRASSISTNSLLTLLSKNENMSAFSCELKVEKEVNYLSPSSQAMNNRNKTHNMFKMGTMKMIKSVESSD